MPTNIELNYNIDVFEDRFEHLFNRVLKLERELSSAQSKIKELEKSSKKKIELL